MKNRFSELYFDKKCRFYITSALSFLFNAAFLVYNFFVGIYFGLVWNFSVSFYYLALLISKGEIIFFGGLGEAKADKKQKIRHIRLEGYFLLILDFVLIAPTLLLLTEERGGSIGVIPAITVALYTTVKVTVAIIKYTKAKKHGNPSYELLRLIGIKEAVVSIITLQNTLIVTFGDISEMRILSTVTSTAFIFFLIIISAIYLFGSNIKKDKNLPHLN